MWISLKKYNKWKRLEKLYNFMEEIKGDERNISAFGDIVFMHDSRYVKMLSRESILKKQVEDLEKYKQLYLDELQKRLELADRVRELEGK